MQLSKNKEFQKNFFYFFYFFKNALTKFYFFKLFCTKNQNVFVKFSILMQSKF